MGVFGLTEECFVVKGARLLEEEKSLSKEETEGEEMSIL